MTRIETSSLAGMNIQTSASQSALREKAAEFEGMLLAQVLQKLDECYRLNAGDDGDSANQSFTSLATSALGGGLARSGGLGLGQMLVQSLQKPGARATEATAAGR